MLIMGQAPLEWIPQKRKVLNRGGQGRGWMNKRMTRKTAQAGKEFFHETVVLIREHPAACQWLNIAVLEKGGVSQNKFDGCAGCFGDVHEPDNRPVCFQNF